MPSSETTSPFLDLPAELRLAIYRYAIRNDSTFSIVPARHATTVFHPPLLLVCKLIKTEATPIFFPNNKFLYSINPGAGDLSRAIQRLLDSEKEALLLMHHVEICFVVPYILGGNCSCNGDAHGRFEYSKQHRWTRAEITTSERGLRLCWAVESCRRAQLERQCHRAYDLLWGIVKRKSPETMKEGLGWQHK